MTFKSWSDLENYVIKACRAAVEDTCTQYLATLQFYIKDDFYEAYSPKKYKRSMQFYNSAVKQMVKGKANEILGKVYMNPDLMQRKDMGNGHVSYAKGFDGKTQLQYAAQAMHGREDLVFGRSYWETFMEDFNESIEEDLIGNLANHGIHLKKA